MLNADTFFTPFNIDIEHLDLPERFTFPFCYQPDPLSLAAVQQLQQEVQREQILQQALSQSGKMLGVLVVKNSQQQLGYFCAFSGKELADECNINFVPPIVSSENKADFYDRESKIINQLNSELDELASNPKLNQYQQQLSAMQAEESQALTQLRAQMAASKQLRKAQRESAKNSLGDNELAQRLQQLAIESVADKNALRDLKQYWQDKITEIADQLALLIDAIQAIKNQRKRLSTRLQKKLFKQYRLLNSAGIEKDLIDIFASAPHPMPPSGAGDCAAPKLLQFAFSHHYTPIAMAEFWWGKSPKSAIRQHKNFYGACLGKCQPILQHMLAGITLDDNPLLINHAEGKSLPIVYQDEHMVVVNKPGEFLSVPGKHVEDSVYLRIKQQFPHATGSLIVHRLDMSTSGLMVLALTKRAQKHLQQQFINRAITKRYLAIVEGDITEQYPQLTGEITLPLRGDFNDRPRQLVCFEHGKAAKTQWQVIGNVNGKTKLYLYPETGRTHQLRVHCAHFQGLNSPILGDDLYGKQPAKRLHLQAQKLTLTHPVTQEKMSFEVDEDF